jgi:hypothetical protein
MASMAAAYIAAYLGDVNHKGSTISLRFSSQTTTMLKVARTLISISGFSERPLASDTKII